LRFSERVTLPASLWIEEHEAGVVTSVAQSPALGWIGLGYLRSIGGAEAPVVQSRSADRTVLATVSALPFKAA
jgi:glycine cleavage system aminomethyltransferase T